MPLARLFVIYAAACARRNIEPAGPTFVERAWLEAKARSSR
jgi:hypothetical protein